MRQARRELLRRLLEFRPLIRRLVTGGPSDRRVPAADPPWITRLRFETLEARRVLSAAPWMRFDEGSSAQFAAASLSQSYPAASASSSGGAATIAPHASDFVFASVGSQPVAADHSASAPAGASRQLPDPRAQGRAPGRDYAALSQELFATLTTTASPAPLYLTGTAVSENDENESPIAPQLAQSGSLINLDSFRTDPRFSGIDGSGFAVVVVDTGINYAHPFFGDRIVYSWDFADNDSDASDVHGHGSNVTSIVASEDATYTGVAPGADIVHLKVFHDAGGGNFGYVEQALQWVVANAATYSIAAVNLSLGDSANHTTSQTLYGIDDELAALAALDIITVSSSGNSFYNFNSVQGVAYPSADANSLSIGAVFDADVGWVAYTNGATAYTTAPDVVTPFSQRHSTLSSAFAPGAPITGAGHIGSGTSTMHGTSQAAPQVTGAAVLAQQIATQHLGRRLTPDEFQTLLNSTGVSIVDGDNEDDNVTNTGLTFQRLDMQALGEAILEMSPVYEILVTTENDVVDANDGKVSLREAVIQANNTPGDFTILLGEGVYTLEIGGANEDAAATGDLDILANGSVTIVGAGADKTTIDAGGLGDRVFQVFATASLTLDGVTIRGGAAGSSADGGGILNAGSLTVLNSEISANSARDGGAVFNSGTVLVRSSTLWNNTASRDGGGIYHAGGLFDVSNSTLSGNSAADHGGGVYVQSTGLSAANSTITDNHARTSGTGSGQGGGIYVHSGTPELHNALVVGNVRGGAANDVQTRNNNVRLSSASSFNLFGTGGSGGLTHGNNGNLVVDNPSAVLDPVLKTNGGPTLTHALIEDSPAIDAGDPNFNPQAFDPPLTTDQRGRTRVAHPTGSGTARIDIGAYELQPPGTLEATLVSGTLTISDIADGGAANQLTLSRSGADLLIHDAAERFIAAPSGSTLSADGHTLTISLASVNDLAIDLGGGDDTLTVDFTAGNPIPTGGLNVDGGSGADALNLVGGAFHSSRFTYASANDGTIVLDPNGNGQTTHTITYAGLQPIDAAITSSVVELIYTGGDETISVADAGDGRTTAESLLGAVTTFANPTDELRIVAANGSDTINVNSLAEDYASLVIQGDDVSDAVNFSGPLTFAADQSVIVSSVGTVEFSFTSGITTTGSGAVNLTALRNIMLWPGATLATVDGGIMLLANPAGTTVGNFSGIVAVNATIETTGSGDISLSGFGADNGNVDSNQHGIYLHSGTIVRSTAGGADAGTITIDGVGGKGTNSNRGVLIRNSGTQVTSVDGDIQITGQGGDGSTSNNHGVTISHDAVISSAGTGSEAATITIDGTGGGGTGSDAGVLIIGSGLDSGTQVTSIDGAIVITGRGGDGTGSSSGGVSIWSGAIVSSTGTGSDAATITINGTGGTGTNGNRGVLMMDSGTRVTSFVGNILVTGQGGDGSGSSNVGVHISGAAFVSSKGEGADAAKITIHGSGGAGTGSNQGVYLWGSATRVGSVDGDIQISGTAGSGDSFAIELLNSDAVEVTGTADVTLIGDSMNFPVANAIAAGANTVTLKTATIDGSIGINIGGTGSASELGLTNDELNRITAGVLNIGTPSGGSITVTDAITRSAATDINLISGNSIIFDPGSIDTAGGTLSLSAGTDVRPISAGVDAAASTLSFAPDSTLRIEIDGPEVDSQYHQLRVAGGIDLTGVALEVAGTAVLQGGETFVVVRNDGSDPIVGRFTGLDEGAVIEDILGSGLEATITYFGGDGHDAVITVQQAPPIIVTTFDDVVDANDGETSLREAIIEANSRAYPVTIVLSEGTYTLSIPGANEDAALTGDLDILPGGSVTIVGAGAEQTIIDASGLGDRVFDVLAGADLRLEGVKVTGGTAENNHGGGILNLGRLHLYESAVIGNSAEYGGGIRNSGELHVQASVVSNNVATFGGGIRSSGEVTIADSVVAQNTAATSGGGVSNFGGDVTITRSTVSGNASGWGGGLWTNATAVIVDSTFADNQVSNNGGGISNSGNAQLSIHGSTFVGNVANFGGGLLSNAVATVVNSTFSGNDSRDGGGGAISSGGQLTIHHSTIVGNRTDANGNGSGIGGGIRRSSGTVTIHHTIIAGNFRGTGTVASDVEITEAPSALEPVSSYNLIGDAASSGGLSHGVNGNIVGNEGTGTLDAADILDPILADNGGPTWTHALVAGSPAIDAGNPNFDPSAFTPPLTTDQRGMTRVVDGLGNEIARIDIGAYELQQPLPVSRIVVTTFDDIIDPDDGVVSLREAIIQANNQDTDVTIVLAAGSYTLSIQGSDEDAALTGDLDILPGGRVTIVGAGASETTIAAGTLGDRIFHVHPGAEAMFEGVTLSGGTAHGDEGSRLGGAILNSGQLIVASVDLSGNAADFGGAVANHGELMLSDSRLIGNTAAQYGGAIYNFDTGSLMTITDSLISGNVSAHGGGAAVLGGTLKLSDSTISDNSVSGAGSSSGGGIFVGSTAAANLTAVTIADNVAPMGGGLLTIGNTVVRDSTLVGNHASAAFGGGIAAGGTLTVLGSTLSENTSQQGGGGIAIDGGAIEVRHSTLFGNRADAGGTDAGTGGGIYVMSGSPVLDHSIVAGNLRGSGDGLSDDIAGSVDGASAYNLIGTGGSGGIVHDTDGNLVGIDAATVLDPVLRDNGGLTLTHALIDGSPAIDAGDPDFDPNAFDPPLTTDQTGFERVQSGSGSATPRIDIGAVEYGGRIVVTTFQDTLEAPDGTVSLRDAVIRANGLSSDVTIVLPAGTYSLTRQGAFEDAALTGDLDILAGGSVRIVGAGAGETIIDAGELGDRVFHVLTGARLHLEGLTVSGGTTPTLDVGDAENRGGGILNLGELTLVDTAIVSNTAFRGGGIYNAAGSVDIAGSLIADNSALTLRADGGGIYNAGGTITIADSELTGNNAHMGGGIYNAAGSLSLARVTVSNNSTASGGSGHGIHNSAVLEIADSVIANNGSGSGNGGGILSSGSLTVLRSVVANNQSGGIFNSGTMLVRSSTITDNVAASVNSYGGGIDNRGTGFSLVLNSTISGNSAHSNGGGVAHTNTGSLVIAHSTIFGNFANEQNSVDFAGGGLYIFSGSVELRNTIIAGNRQGGGASEQPSDIVRESNAVLNGAFSLIGDAATSGGLAHDEDGNIVGVEWSTVLDPNLADNGGPTLTHALLADSPAIDAGDPDFDADDFDPPLLYDQRGFARVSAGRVDIGAFEYRQNQPPVLSLPAVPIEVTEGQWVTLAELPVSVSDPDAGSGNLTMVFTVPGNGEFQLKQGPSLGSILLVSATHVEFTGTLDELNLSDLALVEFRVLDGYSDATVVMNVHVTDNGNTGEPGAPAGEDQGQVIFEAINAAPVLSPIDNQTAQAGNELTIEGFFSDAGALDHPWTVEVDWDGSGFAPAAVLNEQGAFTIAHTYAAAGSYNVQVRVVDKDDGVSNVETFAVEVTSQQEAAAVVGRHIFYNRSFFDGGGVDVDGSDDDAAIAIDKTALLPGQTATFANYTSYSRGINGIMIDLAGAGGEISVDDFEFRVGNTATPDDWPLAPSPESITVIPGAGVNGSDRVVIKWPDNAIEKQWLRVTVLATPATELASPDVHYWGNAVGESGNSETDARVDLIDVAATRENQTGFSIAAIDNPFDYNRDGRVNLQDVAIARENQSGFTPLRLLVAPD